MVGRDRGESEREKERGREQSYLLAGSTNACNNRGWAGSTSQISHVGYRVPTKLRPHHCCYAGYMLAGGWRQELS